MRLSARSKEQQKHANSQRAEVTVHLVGHGVVRAECEESTLYAAIDKSAGVIARALQAKKERNSVKGGVHTHHRAPASIKEVLPAQPLELDVTREPTLPAEVVRRKVFNLTAMSVETAIEEMGAMKGS